MTIDDSADRNSNSEIPRLYLHHSLSSPSLNVFDESLSTEPMNISIPELKRVRSQTLLFEDNSIAHKEVLPYLLQRKETIIKPQRKWMQLETTSDFRQFKEWAFNTGTIQKPFLQNNSITKAIQKTEFVSEQSPMQAIPNIGSVSTPIYVGNVSEFSIIDPITDNDFLGQGTFARVYSANISIPNLSTPLKVAVKKPHYDEESYELLLSEAINLKRIHSINSYSPGVIGFVAFAAFSSDSTPIINLLTEEALQDINSLQEEVLRIFKSRKKKLGLFIEFSPFGNLQNYLRKKASATESMLGLGELRPMISFELFIEWSLQLCNALLALQQASVVHHDIKPHNILLMSDLSLKLCDFGNSTFGSSLIKREECLGKGTNQFTAPEVFGSTEVVSGFGLDIYSLGVTLYTLLTSQDPFSVLNKPGVSSVQLLIAVKKGFFESGVNPSLPVYEGWNSCISEIIMECLSKDPSKRPSITDLIECFRGFAK